jgi:hypothetical protein
MAASLTRAAPVRFLIAVAATWTMARGVTIAGWSPPETPLMATAPAPLPALLRPEVPPLVRLARSPPPLVMRPDAFALVRWAPRRVGLAYASEEVWRSASEPLRSRDQERYDAAQLLMLAAYSPGSSRIYARTSGLAHAAAVAGQRKATPGRWSGSAWAFLRGGGRASTLSPGGQIGGGQAGARILYRLDRAGRLSAAARVSTAIGGARQSEAAFGLDWKPVAALPVHLMAERRVALDHGGRNAWTLGAAGGVDDVRIAPGWRLDAYGEAGVVGAHRRDLYADGAARIARAIDLGHGTSLAVGGGAWGAAQPGASRLDVGPSVVLRLPVDHHVVAVALDWRERVLGDAKPGSGVALTVATDF